MAQANATETARGRLGVWLFRGLVVAGAAFMVYSWFSPWWGATVSVLPGEDHLVMRPWGVQVVAQVRANADESLYSMPWFFAPFMWTYLALCMLALAASLFVNRQVSLGRLRLSLAPVLIGLVGLSYLIAVGLAYEVGTIKAQWADSNFIGKSTITNAMTGNKFKMVSDLKTGYWLALGAGPVLIVVALLRRLLVGKTNA